MKFFAALSFVAILAGSAAAAEKVQWKVGKGEKLSFAVKKANSMERSSSQGEFKSTGSSELQYRIEVAEAKGSDLELKVTYGPVKAKQEGRVRTWEFDSSKKDEGNEASKLLGQVLRVLFDELPTARVRAVADLVAPAPEVPLHGEHDVLDHRQRRRFDGAAPGGNRRAGASGGARDPHHGALHGFRHRAGACRRTGREFDLHGLRERRPAANRLHALLLRAARVSHPAAGPLPA